MKKYEILDADQNMSFNSIVEAIDDCFGKDYKAWMKACYPSAMPEGTFRAWFPKLAPKKNGVYVPAANGCINTISDDWEIVKFDDTKTTSIEGVTFYTGIDLIFAKDENGSYIFRGAYKLDMNETTPHHNVSKRIAKKVKLIGDPVISVDLL